MPEQLKPPEVVYSRATWHNFKPKLEKKFLYFSQKNVFLIYCEMELSSPKIKKFQEETFQARKIKKLTLKIFLTFREMEISSPNLK